jgi:hypothetical protein
MDTQDRYKQIIENTLVSVQETLLSLKEIEVSLSLDHQRGEYILITDVWEDGKRFYYPLIHISLKNNQEVWLKCDNTDLEIGQMLINQGIDRQLIVLAFYSPKMRAYTKITH